MSAHNQEMNIFHMKIAFQFILWYLFSIFVICFNMSFNIIYKETGSLGTFCLQETKPPVATSVFVLFCTINSNKISQKTDLKRKHDGNHL